MSQEVLSISRDGQELGHWKPEDVARMIAAGVLSTRDLFWKEGMSEWTTLEHFVPPQRPVEVFPVTFGSRFSVDQLRFVGPCEVLINAAGVEFVGKRLWPGWARLLAFVAGTPVVFMLVTALGHVLLRWERGGDDVSFAVVLHVFVLLLSFIGSPLIVFTLMNYLCCTQGGLRIERAAITGLTCEGRTISFLALLKPGERRRTRFQAANATDAAAIAQLLMI